MSIRNINYDLSVMLLDENKILMEGNAGDAIVKVTLSACIETVSTCTILGIEGEIPDYML